MKNVLQESDPAPLFSNARRALAAALETVYETFYPNACALCGRATESIPCPLLRLAPPVEATLCENCRKALAVDKVFCPFCGSPFASPAHSRNASPSCGDAFRFDLIYPLNFYRGFTRGALLKMKREFFPVVATALASLFYAKKRAQLEKFAPDCVVAVPMHWGRRFQRGGVNAPDSLAKTLAAFLDAENMSRRIKRIRATQPQTSVETWRRADNVAGAFRVSSPDAFRRRRVLLVDDACTTGATVSEIARVLKEAGADAVCVGTLARAGLSRRFIAQKQRSTPTNGSRADSTNP